MFLRLASLAALAALLVFPPDARAERLPVKSYTAADGLAHDRVMKIVRDSRGFLWFCTAGGLSRFDGSRFVTYSTDDGLPIHTLTDFLENQDGSYWIATNGAGLVRYAPLARDARVHGSAPRFTVLPIDRAPAPNRVNVIHRGQTGRLWIGTDGGLFDSDHEGAGPTFRRIPLNLASHPDGLLQVWSILEDADNSLWIGTSAGLIRRMKDGRSIWYHIRPARGSDHVWTLMIDPARRLWIGHDAGLIIMPIQDLESWSGGMVSSTTSSALSGTRVLKLLPSSDGRVWIGTDAGLYEFAAGRWKEYRAAHGLEEAYIQSVAEDQYGNIWAATVASGATRIARDGLTTYTRSDGLEHEVIGMLFETRNGRFCAVGRGPRLNIFDGQRFQAVAPKLPRAGHDARGDSYYAMALHDRAGEWWIPAGDRLYRFPAVTDPARLAAVDHKAVYILGGGPGSRGIWRLFEDSRGDVWIARRVPSPEVLIRLERATGTLHRYSERDGLPLSAANTFAEDRSGNLWIGFWDGGLVRYRNGRFQGFSAVDRALSGGVSALHVDRANRLWCGTSQGVVRIDDVRSDRPHLVRYTTTEGLSDNMVGTLTEDESGRLYIGTLRGVDRLNPESGRIRRFTTGDGLAALETRAAYRDRHGTLWFATSRGVSQLVPRPDPAAPAPTALLQSVSIDGMPQNLPDLGAAAAGPLTAVSARSRVEIEFFALSFQPGETVRYQYRLDGIDTWSPPSEQASVIYPHLPHGTYRFVVRAIGGNGAPGSTPAALTFTIPPPLWAQWWFLATAATGIILAVHAGYRYRLARLLEIERIRTRLAMDLHDDIGSTLSQVAVLSEVARNRVVQDRRLNELLERIAEISRQLIDAMSDVVWAINPERDSLRDLLQRMRRFATDTLDAPDIKCRFDGPGDDCDVRLDSHVRREVFLIFKEGIHNLLRYARCTRANLGLRIDGTSLVLTIADDGIGVGPLAYGNGLGLRSMRERADRLGADLNISSAPGEGTTVRLVVPLGRPARRHRAARKEEEKGFRAAV